MGVSTTPTSFLPSRFLSSSMSVVTLDQHIDALKQVLIPDKEQKPYDQPAFKSASLLIQLVSTVGETAEQSHYEKLYVEFYEHLALLAQTLRSQRFLSEAPSHAPGLADCMLFAVLARYDCALYVHYKLNKARLPDLFDAVLFEYACDISQWPSVAQTTNFYAIRAHEAK